MDKISFTDVAAVLAIAAAVGAVGLKLRQPLIISFLFAGILVGPSALGLVKGANEIELLASIGISLLLFVVGLRLDIGMIRTVGPVALATGLGQVAFTSLVGFAIAMFMGMRVVTAVYVAVALTFSSTIIIVKLLSDKKEIDSLHGRIAVGFLIVQDIVAILALIGLTAFGSGQQERSFLTESLWVLAKGILMLGTIAVLIRWVLPRAVNYIARSQELLVLFAITWAILLSSSADLLGFSKEVGAFLAGVSLASTRERDAIGARLVVLRDFMLLFFFINLGAQLDVSALKAELGKAFIFSGFVLIGNPLIVMAIMGWMGYRKRTGFMSGLAVAQISEFSLILAALGLSLGHIDSSAMSLITLVGLVTICASTYMILYSGPLYARLSPFLGIFERKNCYRECDSGSQPEAADDNLIIVMGLGNYGGAIASKLLQHGWHLLAVDFDPQALERGNRMKMPVLYGDIADPELLAQLPLDKAKWVLCSIRDRNINMTLMNLLREKGFTGRIALTAADPAQAKELNRLGAHVVLRPFSDAAEQAVEAVTGVFQSLPNLRDWPVVLEEVSLQPGTLLAGKTLCELALRRELGVSVLAVSRAGKVNFNPASDFRIYPGDRIVLLCPPENLARAVEHLRQRELGTPQEQTKIFDADEIYVSDNSAWLGKSLAELDFTNHFGVTVIGIRRGFEQITSPSAEDVLQAQDSIIIVGSAEGVAKMKTSQNTGSQN
ncbi:MAG: cation:proton antiporter [Phycisphaerae bacterium]|jgi:Kef-type K+ transport system membrane component KefB/Trk K+ transport system NAD-binding subunit